MLPEYYKWPGLARAKETKVDRRNMLGALLALAASSGSGLSRAASKASASRQTLIRIDIPGPHLMPYIPIELIPILGFDRAVGAQLAIRYMPSGVQALEDVLAGNAHFAGVGFSVMPTFVSKGKGVAAIATLSSGTPPYSVLIRNDLKKQVRSLADLRGRSIGIPFGSSTTKTYLQMLMEIWLESYGVQPDQVRWVPATMNLEGMQGILAGGVVDAVFCEEPLSGTLLRQNAGTVLASLADPKNPARFVGSNHLRAVLASSTALLEADPKRAELMATMLRTVLAWMRKTPPEKIVARLGVADASLAQSITDAMVRIPDMFSLDGRFIQSEIDSTRAFLKAAKAPLPNGMDIHALVRDQWVKARR